MNFQLRLFVCALGVSAFLSFESVAQQPTTRPLKQPIPLPLSVADSLRGRVQFLHPSNRAVHSLKAHNAASGHHDTIVPFLGDIKTVPVFSRSFSFQGQTFPFTMVGHDPNTRPSKTDTVLIPVILIFPDFVDNAGNPFILDPTGIVDATLASPIWSPASFPGTTGQFGDAVMRATFHNRANDDWHDRIDRPRILKPVVVEVPGDDANLFFLPPNGSPFAVLDSEFWNSQLGTILQLENIQVNEFVVVLTQDMFIAPNADPSNGFALGFHEAFATGQVKDDLEIQTFAWASWVSATALQGQFSDILPLSHEVGEWLNDPFGINPVPPFQIPGAAPGTCQSNLEVGDPLAGVPFPITVNGNTYNPQVLALLQWFERRVPSNALDGDYSYPDPTLLTSPPPVCKPAK